MVYTVIHTGEGNATVIDSGFGPNADNEIFWEERVMTLMRHVGDDFINNYCPACDDFLVGKSTGKDESGMVYIA